jgi:LuxR family transcriptional regulator, regulator of acetate metabolism
LTTTTKIATLTPGATKDRQFAVALRQAAEDLLRADPADQDADQARRLIDAMDATLDRLGTTLLSVPLPPRASADLADEMMSTGELQSRLRRHVSDLRLHILRRTYESLARIRSAATVTELTRIVPVELCAACGFDRAVISSVDGSTWIPTSLHIHAGGHTDAARRLQERIGRLRIPLRPPLVEAELVRRGTAMLVEDIDTSDRTYEPLMELADTQAYVVAPITIGGRVVGFLHADANWTRRPLTDADVDNIRTFAVGVGLAIERTVLRERLATQRRRVAESFESTTATITDLSEDGIRLTRRLERREPEPASAGGGMARIATIDADVARDSQIHGMLTPRERDVLERLARGATNGQIADELVVCVSTVKSHVKHILRKLKATNRAEAVSRYMRLTDDQRVAS